ncbi:MAG: DUF1013 domain-containing protein [Alphaproteobacteria bacterium]|nr:DUF1013 domain-containing protein [Alphaproteobacteria bacterium]
MPKATAMWLINNTTLTFDQIAEFCGLHPLEVKAMADDLHPEKIVPLDPTMNGQLTREEITAGEKDPRKKLVMAKSAHAVPEPKNKSRPRYTPVSRRQDRPDAIAWIVRNHPELTDAEIGKLIGTTKATIQAIRNRTHWNIANIKPVDPVTLGLTSQLELDLAVTKAADRKAKTAPPAEPKGATLKPASETTQESEEQPADEETAQMKYDPASVFASFQRVRGGEKS